MLSLTIHCSCRSKIQEASNDLDLYPNPPDEVLLPNLIVEDIDCTHLEPVEEDGLIYLVSDKHVSAFYLACIPLSIVVLAKFSNDYLFHILI